MDTKASSTIILNEQKDKVLLVRRRDFPLWDLPGGRVGGGESPIKCAQREAAEETGYTIHIKRKIGEYRRPKLDEVQHIFLGEVISGRPLTSTDEIAESKWFRIKMLPLLMVHHRREQIKDYLKGNYDLEKTLKDSDILVKINKILKTDSRKKKKGNVATMDFQHSH